MREQFPAPVETYTVEDAEQEHQSGEDLAERLTELPELLAPRIEKAIDACEFENSPEVSEAIRGYYNDHYKLALIAERAIQGESVDPEIIARDDTTLEAYDLVRSVHDMIDESDRASQFQKINELIKTKLFAEVGVGITTIDDGETAVVEGLYDQMLEQARAEDIRITYPAHPGELRRIRESQTKNFWKDSRAAGQLEFHNTPFADKLAAENFMLRTRSNQVEHTGDFQAVTIASEGHSQSLHFSEEYMTDGYKRVQAGKQVAEVTVGGTIAVPLAEVVKQLPYARGGEYGVVTLKNNVEPKMTVIDSANILALGGGENPGGDDLQPSEYGTDRTFYADKFDQKKAENYALDFGRATNSKHGPASSIIYLERDLNTAYRQQYKLNAGRIDHRIDFGAGEGHPIVKVLDFDYGKISASDVHGAMKPGERFVPKDLANYSANSLGIIDPRLERKVTEHYSYREGTLPEQQAHKLRAEVETMQRESREHPNYRGKAVVMLRGGTMAFEPRG